MTNAIRKGLAAAATIALTAAMLGLGAGAAQAYPAAITDVKALIFSNDNVVDTGREYLNELGDLESLGVQVTPFDGGDGSVGNWTTALAGIDLFVLPEQETDIFYETGGKPWISDAAYQVLKNWVDAGGLMIVNGANSYSDGKGGTEKPTNVALLTGFTCLDFTGLLDTIQWDSGEGGAGLAADPELESADQQFSDAEFAEAIDFDLLVTVPGAPDPLPSRDGTFTLFPTNWPASIQSISTPIYSSELNDEVAVITIGVGAGAVLYLGYDWWEFTSEEWYDVLEAAASGALPYTPQPIRCALAATGSETPALPIAAGAGLLLLAGAAVLIGTRRRRTV